MRDDYFIVFNKSGIVDFKKSDRFTLPSGCLAVQMQIEVDDSVFKKPAIPTTRVVIPADAITRAVEVTSEAEVK